MVMAAQPTTDREWTMLVDMIKGIDTRMNRIENKLDQIDGKYDKRYTELSTHLANADKKITVIEEKGRAIWRTSVVYATIFTTLITAGVPMLVDWFKQPPDAQAQPTTTQVDVRPDDLYVAPRDSVYIYPWLGPQPTGE